MDDTASRAHEIVALARRGDLGQAGKDLVALFAEAHRKATEADRLADAERRRREGVEREANALAAVLADLLDGQEINAVVDDLPHDARRRVIAYRHASGPLQFVPPSDQFGRLPRVPPRASVMRDRVRVVDMGDDPDGDVDGYDGAVVAIPHD